MKLTNNHTAMLLILYIAIILYQSVEIHSYAEIETYNGTKFKFYYNISHEQKEECFQSFSFIHSDYRQDLAYIKVFETKWNKYYGMYWWGTKGIELRIGCNVEVLIHELAHHCQMERGDTLWEGKDHVGQFDVCENEIMATYEFNSNKHQQQYNKEMIQKWRDGSPQ